MTSRRIITFSAIAVISIVIELLAGLLFFILQTDGFRYLPEFGMLGVIVFFQSFPWFPLTFIILLTIVLVFLLRRFARFRHRSVFTISFALCALILLIGFLLSLTPLYGQWKPPPPHEGSPVEPLTRGYGAWRFHNIFEGVVTNIEEKSLIILNADDRTFTVQLTRGARFPAGRDIGIGDAVFIIGEMRDGTIRAFGVRKLQTQ